MPPALVSCVAATVSPVATATCYTTNASYLWSFPGGSPASSTSLNPGNITYSTPGNYIITLSVTNDCGTTTQTTTITINPLPVANAGPDKEICSGLSTTIGTPAISGNTYL